MLNLVNLKHGSSDGRASDSRSKAPGFNPSLNPIKLSGMDTLVDTITCFVTRINGIQDALQLDTI